MGDFVFCYGLHNKNRLSKYIKQTKKGCKLYLDDENYIKIKIETRSGQKYIVIDFNDSLDFLKFIVKKKISCGEYKHDCNSLYLHNDYLEYVIENKHYDIVKFYCKKFVPLIKSDNSVYPFSFSLFVDIDLDDFKYIFKHSRLEDINPYFIYVLGQSDNITIEFMDDIIGMYKSKLTRLFVNNKISDSNIDKIKIGLQDFIKPVYEKDDVNLFDFIIEEIHNLTSDIDKTKLYKKQLGFLKIFEFYYELDTESINRFINYVLDCTCPKIFKQLLFNLGNVDLLDKTIVRDILEFNMVEYMGIICDFIGDTNPELINKMLTKATSTEMAQLLIDCGADYEKLYESQNFRKCDSCVKKLIKKIIKETSDS